MMIILNRVNDSITGSVNMKNFGIKFNQEKWDEMKRLQAEANKAVSMEALKLIIEQFEQLTYENYKTIVETACPDLMVNEATGKFFLKVRKKVSRVPLPQPLVDRILKSVEKGIDPTPVVKACIRFMRNPNFSLGKFRRFADYINYMTIDQQLRDSLVIDNGLTVEVATERATLPQTPITMEGLICTYKVSSELFDKFSLGEDGKVKRIPRYKKEVDEDTGEVKDGIPEFVEDRVFYPAVQGLDGGDAFTCETLGSSKKGHLIRVGARHFLDSWDQVNCDDNDSCVKGLHVGKLNCRLAA